MKAPDYLGETGKNFWKKHNKRLQSAGLLTPADYESFALLCMTWERMLEASKGSDSKDNVNYNSLSKQFVVLAKQFCLLPKDRKKSGLDTTEETADEFGI